MSRLILGAKPSDLTVILSEGADFQTTLRLNENWPGGVTVELVFGNGHGAWEATVSGADAVFNEDKAVTDLIPASTPVKLVVTEGTADEVWAVGEVVRR